MNEDAISERLDQMEAWVVRFAVLVAGVAGGLDLVGPDVQRHAGILPDAESGAQEVALISSG